MCDVALVNLSESMLRGVGATAIGVAIIRARETDHPDGLVNDSLAAALAAAARQGFAEKAGLDGSRPIFDRTGQKRCLRRIFAPANARWDR